MFIRALGLEVFISRCRFASAPAMVSGITASGKDISADWLGVEVVLSWTRRGA